MYKKSNLSPTAIAVLGLQEAGRVHSYASAHANIVLIFSGVYVHGYLDLECYSMRGGLQR